METKIQADNIRYERMNTQEMRDSFLLTDLFKPGESTIYYLSTDRAVVGGCHGDAHAVGVPHQALDVLVHHHLRRGVDVGVVGDAVGDVRGECGECRVDHRSGARRADDGQRGRVEASSWAPPKKRMCVPFTSISTRKESKAVNWSWASPPCPRAAYGTPCPAIPTPGGWKFISTST